MSSIRCTKCGSETTVLETREYASYTRRRRLCQSAVCSTRLTTAEFVLPNATRFRGGDLVVVRREDIERLTQIARHLEALPVITRLENHSTEEQSE